MAVTLPREGRYKPKVMVHDWAEARRRLEAEPGEWVLALDGPITGGSVSWLRREGPLVLADIHEEIEWKLRDSVPLPPNDTMGGTLYARWTPGEAAPQYMRTVMSDEEVVAARVQYTAGRVTQRELAERYGVSLAGISGILRGKSRLDAGGPIWEGKR